MVILLVLELKMDPKKKLNLKRWQYNRLGIFIHWGLYALAARHEWVKAKEKITTAEYKKYFKAFNPDLYNPAEWARAAKAAGMKYVVLTAKHHEGFCLWDSRFTDYKCTNTPYKKDLLKIFVRAFREAGLRIGIYYSLLDWHHPDYTTDCHHPQRDNAEFAKKDKKRKPERYANYIYNQVTELLTDYGEIDLLFLDFSVYDHENKVMQKGRETWQSENLVKMIRKKQPGMLINDRLDLQHTNWGWDFITPEQCMLQNPPKDKTGNLIPWETCQTFSGSWGYFRDEYTWKNVPQLIKLLVDTVSKGGNLLLNVGPTARGEFDVRVNERLQGLRNWMAKNSRAIYGCTFAPENFTTPQDCRLTWHPESNRLYLHVFSWPATGELFLPGMKGKIAYAQLLHDASEITFNGRADWQAATAGETNKGVLSLKLPIAKPCAVPVIELFLK